MADFTRLPRNIQRFGEIVFVFARHGFGPVIGRLNLQEHIPFARRFIGRRIAESDRGLSTEKRLVRAFQELGTTFIKLGQVLSSRPDLVGETFAEECRELREHVEAFDAAVVRRIIEEELGAPVAQLFRAFEDTPAGCGSIAQVHCATLHDGTAVMVKVRRPGIERAILADMAILRLVAHAAEGQLPGIRATQIVEEFDRAIRGELDLSVEASNTARFHEMLKDVPGVCSPSVIWEMTTSAVLVVRRIEGVSIGNIEELERRGHDLKRLAKALADCFMLQYLKEGTFHADPHPGNILVCDDGAVALIDFGTVGYLSNDLRDRLTTMLIAAVTGDIDLVAETAVELGVSGEGIDPKRFNRDLADLFHKYQGMPLGRIDTGRLFADLTRTAHQNDLVLPRDLVLLARSMATLSAVTRALDPAFDILRMSAPRLQELVRDKLSPGRLAKVFGMSALGLMQLVRSMPRDLRSIIRKLESGQLQVGFRHRGLEHAMSELDRASNRLAISIYVAALLVASSLMIKTGILVVGGLSAPGVLGYALAGILSIWLAWGILRSGRL